MIEIIKYKNQEIKMNKPRKKLALLGFVALYRSDEYLYIRLNEVWVFEEDKMNLRLSLSFKDLTWRQPTKRE